MRLLGPVLILVGAVATIAAMFLPFASYEGESINWWETFNGLDIALVAACILTGGLALATLISGNRAVRHLTGIAAAVTFGLAFALIPDTIHDSEGAGAGRWLVAGTAALALAGAVVIGLARFTEPPLGSSSRVEAGPS
jgi:hypothetical protein